MAKEISMHPDRGAFDFNIGMSFLNNRDYDTAIGYFQKALAKRLSPIHKTMTLDALGNCYNERSDIEKAKEYYRKAIDTTPNYVYSLNSLGNIYFNEGRYEEARQYFEKAVKTWPNDFMFNKNLGSAYHMLGDDKKAIYYWKWSLEINRNQPDIVEFIREAEGQV
jgi:tetratricopeptide (TPR) repeat protein